MIVAAWTIFGLLHAAFWVLTTSLSVEGEVPMPVEVPVRHLLGLTATALLLAWTWAALTPLIFRLAAFATPRRIGWFGTIAMHAGAFLAIASGVTALRHALLPLLTGEPPSGLTFLSRLVFLVDVQLFTYLTVVLTGRAIASHRRYVDRALRAHVLETQLARAQLHFLELQLQPHFLFNSLNTIQELAHESPDAAERMLRRLHALLAMSLERSGRDEVSLADELAALEPYVDIQRTRFDWLSVRIQADEEARAALVPHLILQPLVENAIRHGLAVRNQPGHIEVVAERVGERLRMRVQDDGVGLAPLSESARRGIGLRNASERLRQLHGTDHHFKLAEAPGGGAVVEIDIPYRRAERVAAPTLWTEAPPSRETVPEITMEEISAWRTGEFETAVSDSEAAEIRREAARTRAARDKVPATFGADGPARPAAVFETVASSSEPAPPLLTVRTWLALVVFWLGAAVLWTLQIQGFSALLDGMPFQWSASTARLQLAGAMYWIAVSLGVLYLSRRFRLGRRRFLLHLAIHLGAAVLVSFGFLWVLQALRFTDDPILNPFNINPLTGNFFIYFGLLAWSHARDFVAWYRSHEITSVQLTSQIARSRFQALCVQVRPQFLLGTLDLLARLVHVDVPRAERLIARLADVLRLTLDMAREHTTTLQQELQLLSASVEAHRLGIRPNVRLETNVDPAALATPMPSRLLCTMVDDLLAAEPENGGILRAVPPLAVRVTAERGMDATRIRLRGDTDWKTGSTELHAWWRKKSAAEAAVADAGPLVTVAFPDQATAVLIVADEPVVTSPVAA